MLKLYTIFVFDFLNYDLMSSLATYFTQKLQQTGAEVKPTGEHSYDNQLAQCLHRSSNGIVDNFFPLVRR